MAQRSITASVSVVDGAAVLQRGMETARHLWNQIWWCQIGYNDKVRRWRWHAQTAVTGKRAKYPGKFGIASAMNDYWAYRDLSDRCSGYTIADFDIAIRSWWANLKSNPDARPPRYSKEPRTLTFEIGRNAKHLGDWRFRLTVGGGHMAERHCVVRVHVREGVKVEQIKLLRIKPLVKRGRYQCSLTTQRAGMESAGAHTAALDLGIINVAALAIDDGALLLYSGKALLDENRLAHKRAAACKPAGWQPGKERLPASERNRTYRVRARNITDLALQQLTTHVMRTCRAHGVGKLAVGELTGIRTAKDFGRVGNQKLHAWPFRKVVEMLRWKGEDYGIEVVAISERYTSQTCSCCGCVRKANRIERGLYHCQDCGIAINADINGARNILAKVSPVPLVGIGVGAEFPGPPSPEKTQGIGEANTLQQMVIFDRDDWRVIAAPSGFVQGRVGSGV